MSDAHSNYIADVMGHSFLVSTAITLCISVCFQVEERLASDLWEDTGRIMRWPNSKGSYLSTLFRPEVLNETQILCSSPVPREVLRKGLYNREKDWKIIPRASSNYPTMKKQ